MKCLTDEQIDQLRADERQATVRAAIGILRRRAESSTATFAASRELVRAAGEIEALLVEGLPAGEGVSA
jgi:hypothetical protein